MCRSATKSISMETAYKWLMTDLRRDHCIGDFLEKRATKLLGIGAPYNKETGLDVLEDWFNQFMHQPVTNYLFFFPS
jgi:hypothetical protein